MKIAIITNEKTKSNFSSLIKAFSYKMAEITNTYVISDDIETRTKIKNNVSNKTLYLFPTIEFNEDNVKLKASSFYIFWVGVFSKLKKIENFDVIIILINLKNINENILFKFFKQFNKYHIDSNKAIFIGWVKDCIQPIDTINLSNMQDLLKSRLIDDIYINNNKEPDLDFVDKLIQKLREK